MPAVCVRVTETIVIVFSARNETGFPKGLENVLRLRKEGIDERHR